MRWLAKEERVGFDGYPALHAWSVQELPRFWASVARYFSVRFHEPPREVLAERRMPGARFFPGATLNYAEHALRRSGPGIAVITRSETEPPAAVTWDELRDSVARALAGLRRLGVTRGDTVAAVLPNAVEALACFLATASLGATWTCCAPEFGVDAVLDRFRQVSPKVLIAVDGYRYGGKLFDRSESIAHVTRGLPSLTATVIVPRLGRAPSVQGLSYAELTSENAPLAFEPCAFDHPLWVLYSSGTSGPPKAIVHGHGGILLEHLKVLSLHGDLGTESRFFWFTTTGWMMWNYLVGGLLTGATICLYDGHPTYPDPEALFRYAAADGVTDFGVSAPFLLACEKQGVSPGKNHDLSKVRAIGSTGAPLPASGFGWVYENVKRDVWLASVSGGTDVCTGFLVGCPLLPVRAGEIQCAALGVAAKAFDDRGQPLTGAVGELVITEPMPSMPLHFVGDTTGERLRDAYFSEYPGVWRHGDFVEMKADGGAVVFGRSDATLNRGGVRMGTAELYRVLEALPEVVDSLVVDTGALSREDKMWLFVVLRDGLTFTDGIEQRIRSALRAGLSPRHVPDKIVSIRAIPRTVNGKKLEIPVKRLLMGVPRERAVQAGSLADESALDELLAAART
jgi:acetoacetyl-CoA synthetase